MSEHHGGIGIITAADGATVAVGVPYWIDIFKDHRRTTRVGVCLDLSALMSQRLARGVIFTFTVENGRSTTLALANIESGDCVVMESGTLFGDLSPAIEIFPKPPAVTVAASRL